MRICKFYLQSEYGADIASSLSSPLYYKQVEYTDKKGKKKTKIDTSAAPVLYAKLIYSEKSKKILSLFKTKGNKDLNPFKYIDQYCNVKMALIIEGIFMSKTVVIHELNLSGYPLHFTNAIFFLLSRLITFSILNVCCLAFCNSCS